MHIPNRYLLNTPRSLLDECHGSSSASLFFFPLPPPPPPCTIFPSLRANKPTSEQPGARSPLTIPTRHALNHASRKRFFGPGIDISLIDRASTAICPRRHVLCMIDALRSNRYSVAYTVALKSCDPEKTPGRASEVGPRPPR